MSQFCKRAVLTIGVLALATVASAQAVKVATLTTFSPGDGGNAGLPSAISQAADGSLYAISSYSGDTTVAIFRINPDGSHSLMATLNTGQGSLSPYRMVLAANGSFYTTFNGDGGGGIIQYVPGAASASVVKVFDGSAGYLPGPLIVGKDGKLYGATQAFNDSADAGSLFQFDPAGNTVTTLYSFQNGADGAFPFTITEGAAGVFYGTDFDSTFCGLAYKFDSASHVLTPLHTFVADQEGCSPNELAFLPNSTLLAGVAAMGNGDPLNTLAPNGSVFTLDSVTGAVTVIHGFLMSDPFTPSFAANVLVPPGGNVYVVAQNFGINDVSVLRVHPDSGAVDDIADFADGVLTDIGELSVGSDARVYGVFGNVQAFALGVLDPLSVAPASGMFGGTATLSATIKALGMPLAGRTITFSLNGTPVGSAVSNASGVATLSNVSLVGIAAGTYPNAVGASFAGDTLFPAQTGSAVLSVQSAVTPGTMVGDGFINQDQLRYEFGFVVQEKPNGVDRGALELRVKSIDDGHKKKTAPRNDRFVSFSYTNVVFALDPAIPPQYDTATFAGPGYWNGQAGYRFEAYALDRLGPAKHSESFKITIYDSANNVVASVNAVLSGGSMKSARMHK